MVKLTVMYTLPQEADHEAFLKWRTTEHQKENMRIPGVIKSDFYAVREIYTKRLMDSLQKIANPLFLVSEEVLSEGK